MYIQPIVCNLCHNTHVYIAHSLYIFDTALPGKRVRSTSLYHSRQCCIVLKPRSDHGIGHIVIRFMTLDCSQKLLRKQHQCELRVVLSDNTHYGGNAHWANRIGADRAVLRRLSKHTLAHRHDTLGHSSPLLL